MFRILSELFLHSPLAAVSSHLSLRSRYSRRVAFPPPLALFLAVFVLLALPAIQAHATTFTVTDLTDSVTDTGSLRYAVSQVNAGSGGDTIVFSGAGASGTIVLTTTNGPLSITENVTITGPGANVLTVSGNNSVRVFTVNTGITVSISGLAIANGSSSYGGGFYNGGTLTLNNCILSGNASPSGGSWGGGIYNSGTLTVSNSTFSGNTAPGGAAINNGGGDTVTVTNSTFSGNTVTSKGAGITNYGTLTVTNSTFSGNTASYDGGGLFNGGTLTVTNSIIAGNTTTSIANDDCSGCGTQSSNNLISSTASPITTQLLLSPLQYNGGTTPTMLPLTGSPALGAGLSSILTTDQRGFNRPTGSSVASDLGAVESDYLTVTTTTDSTDSGATCTSGTTCSLRDAVTVANANGSGDIVFGSGVTGTITLSSALPSVAASINLSGPGANLLTVSGNNSVRVFNINTGVSVSLSGITIANGNQAGGYGSGIYNGGTLTLSDCALSGNTAPAGGGYGGGIYNGGGTLTVSNCTFSGNTAPGGGAILNNGSGMVTVSNSTFSGNSVASEGGGILNYGTLALNNSTLSGNTASTDGGGLLTSGGTLTVTNSIIAGNTTSSIANDDCSGCGTQSSNNLISSTASPITAAQLMLGPLALNGSNQVVQTLLPLPGSPAIQAGLSSTFTTDQRGLPRPAGSGVVSDLGAVQTNYTAVQFVQQPSSTFINATMTPAVTLSVIESGAAALNIPVALTLTGNGTLGGTLTETTMAPSGGGAAVASYAMLSVNTLGIGDTLDVSLPITPAGATTPLTLTATSSSFDITAVALSSTTTTLAASPTSITAGQSVTFTATVASSSGTPTGTVSFLNGTTSIGTGALNSNGVATFTTSALAAGGNTSFTASYSGDANFAASSSSAVTVTVTAPVVSSYTVAANPSSLTIAAGQTGTTTLTFTPTGGYSGSLTLSCSSLPVNAKCAFMQGGTANSTVNMTGNDAVISVTLTIQTDVAAAQLQVLPNILQTPASRSTTLLAAKTSTNPSSPMNPILPALAFWGPGSLAGLAAFGRKRKCSKLQRGFLQLGLLVLLTGAMVAGISGCGSSGTANVTPAGTSNVMIKVTPAVSSGQAAQTLNLNVTITG